MMASCENVFVPWGSDTHPPPSGGNKMHVVGDGVPNKVRIRGIHSLYYNVLMVINVAPPAMPNGS